MADSKRYEESVSQLYRASPAEFVAERKRLAAELKAGGDKESAKQLEKLPRPSLTAWSVNQLWWQARADFDALFESAARLRSGDLGATRAHRDALHRLRGRAAEILRAGSHAVTDTALRRVANTLAALAANGSFDPDVPGALANDRDAPGFDATGLAGMLAAVEREPRDAERSDSNASRRREQEQEAQRLRAALEAERKRQQQERQKLDAELQRARAAVEAHVKEVERLRNALASEEQKLERARAAAGDCEARLLHVSEVPAGGMKDDPH